MGDKISQMQGLYVKRGSNLKDKHNYGNYSTSMSENIPKCSIDGLEYIYE